MRPTSIWLWLGLLFGPPMAHAVPLMDLVDIEGIRGNQLVGYGLVVGLDGSGDKNQVKFTNQSISNLIKQFGINLPPNVDPKLKNVAAVTVTAHLPPSYSAGQSVDVTVASLGDAKSLRGGQLRGRPPAARPWPARGRRRGVRAGPGRGGDRRNECRRQ